MDLKRESPTELQTEGKPVASWASIFLDYVELKARLLALGVETAQMDAIEEEAKTLVARQFQAAVSAAEPEPATVTSHVFAPTPVTEETGTRAPANGEKVNMVDAALFAIREIMEANPEALLYGQDVGRRLGGVFREAATLAGQFGDLCVDPYRIFTAAEVLIGEVLLYVVEHRAIKRLAGREAHVAQALLQILGLDVLIALDFELGDGGTLDDHDQQDFGPDNLDSLKRPGKPLLHCPPRRYALQDCDPIPHDRR